MTKKEYEEWYEDVDFIQKEMQFYSLEDFISTARYYKDMYKQMNRHAKKLYQWYVYANCNINYNQKNIIWDFLNGFITLPEFTHLIHLQH